MTALEMVSSQTPSKRREGGAFKGRASSEPTMPALAVSTEKTSGLTAESAAAQPPPATANARTSPVTRVRLGKASSPIDS
jgi:hypothetical protein